ncbi:MAG: GAF domain-containing protein [Chloroflexi bacterium]|nr:GAF domain-containing protein [Chloroflexota bacterium]
MHQVAGFDKELLEIYGELDRDRLMTLVVRYASDRLEAGGSSIFLRDDITDRYVLRGTTGLLEGADMPTERVEYEPGEGLTGWIAKHGRPLRIVNVKDNGELRGIAEDLVWSKKYSEISAKPGQAYLGVPILSRDGATVLGVLRVSGKTEGEQFDAQDEALLSHVAAMVSIAIENSQRYEQEKRRARYFRLLLDISSELDPRRPIAEMLQAVTERVRQGFRTEGCQLYLRTEEDVQRVVLRAASGLPETLIGQLTYMVGEGLTGHVVRSGTAVQIREVAGLEDWDDPHIAQVAPHLPSGVYRSFLGVPLQLGDEVLGTLELINKIPSAPGHRDWFTDDDEEYLRLLSTAIGGVLEGARYLKTLSEVGVTAMRMQRVAYFGTLAQRIRHEAANPLAVARLALANLRSDLQEKPGFSQRPGFLRRLDIIEANLNAVSGKLLDLLKFSQQIGFIRTTTNWNDVVREVLIWLAAERQRRRVEMRVTYEDLPTLFIEPNEMFGVLVTILRLTMESCETHGGLIEVHTSLSADGQRVRTEIHAPEASLAEKISSILEPAAGVPEELLPLHFEWALAQETVETQYRGTLTWQACDGEVCFVLELPVGEWANGRMGEPFQGGDRGGLWNRKQSS